MSKTRKTTTDITFREFVTQLRAMSASEASPATSESSPTERWRGIVAVEEAPTGDGRMLTSGSLRWDDGPWPLKWQRDEGGHSGPVVGEITRLWRDGTDIWGEGIFHTDSTDPRTREDVNRSIELVRSGTVGVSIRLDDESSEVRMKKDVWEALQAQYEMWDEDYTEPEPEVKGDRVVVGKFSRDDYLEAITDGRFRELSIVDVAAFAEAKIAIAASMSPNFGIVATPRVKLEHFTNPNFGADGDEDPRLMWQSSQRTEETDGWGCPLTITDDGRIYGHASLRLRCHGAFGACLPPPDLDGDLSQFLIGDATGTGIPTGVITLGTTHGVTDDGKVKSHDHLANTGLGVADVVAGWDRHGMWVSGSLRPGLTDREMAELRGGTLSGEWHPKGDRLRLVGILAVNSPGYLVARTQSQYAIAASNSSGIVTREGVVFTMGAECCAESTVDSRLAALERAVALSLRVGKV